MKQVLIKPTDVLFFRDGRESQAGAEYSAKSLFPPSPVTFYGALRASILSKNDAFQYEYADKDPFMNISENVKEVVGTNTKFGSLTISEFCLTNIADDEDLYILPADILRKKGSKHDEYVRMQTLDLSRWGIRTNHPLGVMHPWQLHKESVFYESVTGFIRNSDLDQYLLNQPIENLKVVSYDEIFLSEPRMHVSIDQTSRTAEESKLFTIPFTRLQKDTNVKLVVDGDGGLLDTKGYVRLGGEGRSASYTVDSYQPSLKPDLLKAIAKKIEENGGYFKWLLLTPAVFQKNGWYPDIFNTNGIGIYANCKLQLLSGSLNRYEIHSGWDLATNRPKPALRAVPAGSVYYGRIIEGDPIEFVKATFGCSLCDKELSKQGLGIINTGVN